MFQYFIWTIESWRKFRCSFILDGHSRALMQTEADPISHFKSDIPMDLS
jgi:hypothetical protein